MVEVSIIELAIGMAIIITGGFIAGAACVGIRLDKLKKQRDEDRK